MANHVAFLAPFLKICSLLPTDLLATLPFGLTLCFPGRKAACQTHMCLLHAFNQAEINRKKYWPCNKRDLL